MAPDVIDGDARSQRVARAHQPAGQIQAVGVATTTAQRGKDRGRPRPDFISGAQEVTAIENSRDARRMASLGNDAHVHERQPGQALTGAFQFGGQCDHLFVPLRRPIDERLHLLNRSADRLLGQRASNTVRQNRLLGKVAAAEQSEAPRTAAHLARFVFERDPERPTGLRGQGADELKR